MNVRLGRTKKPMSVKQKAALAKAIAASAAKRRGTGKPDAPSKPRRTVADYRAAGDARAKKIGLEKSGSGARKLANAMQGNSPSGSTARSRSNNPRTKFDSRSGNQTITRFTDKQRASAVRKAAPKKKPSGRVTLSELTRRSLSSPNTMGPKRELDSYQKADKEIWDEYNRKKLQLENDYNSNRITKRQFELRKKKLGDEAMAKREANIKKYNRDKDGNPATPEKPSSKNTEAMRDSRMAQKPKPHPLETAAGTKPYMLKKQIDQAKPGSVRNQLIAELNRLRKSYWAGNEEIKPEKPSSTTSSNVDNFDSNSPIEKKRAKALKLAEGIGGTMAGDVWDAETDADMNKVLNKIKDYLESAPYEKRSKPAWQNKIKQVNALLGSNAGPKPEKPSSTTGSGSSKPAMGTKDPGEMGVSQILTERKQLIAKQKSEGLTKDEEARLKLIRAESALRHQNRKAGKGTGPTKISMAKPSDAPKAKAQKASGTRDRVPLPPKPQPKTPDKTDYQKQVEQLNSDYAKGKISRSKWLGDLKRLKESNAPKAAPDQPTESARKMYIENLKDRTDRELKSAVSYATGWKKEELQKEIDRRSSNPKKYGVTRSSLGKDSPKNDNLGSKLNTPRASKPDAPKASGTSKKPSADQEWAAKTYGGKPEEYWYDKKTWNLVNGNPKTRDPNTTADSLPKPEDYNDSSKIAEMPNSTQMKLFAMRDSMRQIARKDLERENVYNALNSAKTVGDLVEAAQDIYWYLDEWDGIGRNTSALRKEMDKMFEQLKEYSSRYDNVLAIKNLSNSELSSAIAKATGRRKMNLEAELKRRKGKATGAGVRQPTFNRSTRMSGRG